MEKLLLGDVQEPQRRRLGPLPTPIAAFAERLATVAQGEIHVMGPAGLGDLLWTASKWWRIAAERKVRFWFPDGEPHRAGPLCQMLGFEYGYFPNLTSGMVWEYNDQYGDPEIPDNGAVLVVSPNRHLEAGKRIERWYPELPFLNPVGIIRERSLATTYKIEAGCTPYVVVAMGAQDYMDGQLMPGQWARILRIIEQTVAPVLMIASQRSRSYAERVLKHFDPSIAPAFSVPINELFPIIDRARALVGTASGLTILSTYMGIPTLHAYPRWLKSMPGSWEQEGHKSGDCFLDELENAMRDGYLTTILHQERGASGVSGPGGDVGSGGNDAPDQERVPRVDDSGNGAHLDQAAAELVEEPRQERMEVLPSSTERPRSHLSPQYVDEPSDDWLRPRPVRGEA